MRYFQPRDSVFFVGNLFNWFELRGSKIYLHARHKPLLSLTIAISAVVLSIFVHHTIVSAQNLGFVQTDWSGGADTVSTMNENNLTGWTKYYSKTDGVTTNTVGEAKLSVTITQP